MLGSRTALSCLLAVIGAACDGTPSNGSHAGSRNFVGEESQTNQVDPQGGYDRIGLELDGVDATSRRVPTPGIPFDPEPPAGRDEVWRVVVAVLEACEYSQSWCGRAIDYHLARRGLAGDSLIDILLTEAELDAHGTISVLFSVAQHGRIDALETMFAHADSYSQRFMLSCGGCTPEAAWSSLAYRIRQATVEAAASAHTAEARAFVEAVAAEAATRHRPDAERLIAITSEILATW